MRFVISIIVVFFAVLLIIQNNDKLDFSLPEPTSQTNGADTSSRPVPEVKSKECEKVDSWYLKPEVIISETMRTIGVKVLAAEAVKSNDFNNFYFVQYKMDIPEKGVSYPMFAMNKPFGKGVIYAMDDLAIMLSGLGDGRITQAKFSANDDGFEEATGCLR